MPITRTQDLTSVRWHCNNEKEQTTITHSSIESSQPARAAGCASAYGIYGLISNRGVPSNKSRPCTRTTRSSGITSTILRADSAIGFGRCGALVANRPRFCLGPRGGVTLGDQDDPLAPGLPRFKWHHAIAQQKSNPERSESASSIPD